MNNRLGEMFNPLLEAAAVFHGRESAGHKGQFAGPHELAATEPATLGASRGIVEAKVEMAVGVVRGPVKER